MTSNFFVKFSAVVGTFGLLLPILPVLGLAPSATVPENTRLSQSQELLLTQSQTGCARATVIESFTTDTYLAFICSDGNGDYFYQGINRSNGSLVNVYGVTFTDSGYYMATTYDDYGNEYNYLVGPYLEVYENGELIWQEPTY